MLSLLSLTSAPSHSAETEEQLLVRQQQQQQQQQRHVGRNNSGDWERRPGIWEIYQGLRASGVTVFLLVPLLATLLFQLGRSIDQVLSETASGLSAVCCCAVFIFYCLALSIIVHDTQRLICDEEEEEEVDDQGESPRHGRRDPLTSVRPTALPTVIYQPRPLIHRDEDHPNQIISNSRSASSLRAISKSCSSSCLLTLRNRQQQQQHHEADSSPAAAASASSSLSGCPICLVEFQAGEVLQRGTYCHHAFHPTCIQTWMACSACTVCPYCRQDLLLEEEDPSSTPKGAVVVVASSSSSSSSSSTALSPPPSPARWAQIRREMINWRPLLLVTTMMTNIPSLVTSTLDELGARVDRPMIPTAEHAASVHTTATPTRAARPLTLTNRQGCRRVHSCPSLRNLSSSSGTSHPSPTTNSSCTITTNMAL